MSTIKRTQIADGVFFNSVKDSRFKTMKLSANLYVPLSAETASENALLAGVLSRSCKAYPDFTAMSRKLCALYGADLNVLAHKAGDNQVITLSASGLDIDSEYNDKRIYANGRMTEIMCADEVYGVKRYGTAEAIKAATPESLYAAWERLLRTSYVEIMYIGDSAPDKAAEVFTDAFRSIGRAPVKQSTQIIRGVKEVKRETEEIEVSQSKLVMGFRAGTAVPEKEARAASLMCSILGGTATSKLFCNVREKQSLCYYCGARYDKMKGIVFIDSGVEGENVEKLEAGVLREIEDMKNGVITDFEIEATKMAMINAYHTSNDTVSGIESWYAAQLFDGSFKTIEEMAAAINGVTREEIVAAANRLTLDTVYVLKNR